MEMKRGEREEIAEEQAELVDAHQRQRIVEERELAVSRRAEAEEE